MIRAWDGLAAAVKFAKFWGFVEDFSGVVGIVAVCLTTAYVLTEVIMWGLR